MEASREQINRHEKRLAEHQGRIVELADELGRVTRRVGDLERDRQLVQDLARTTRELAKKAKDLAGGIEAVAERAVEKVLDRRSLNRRQTWYYRGSWIVAAVAIAGFLWDHDVLRIFLGR